MQQHKKAPKVAVVILAYNGLNYIKQFLQTVVYTDYANLVVYVIDNCSTDEVCAYVNNNFPKVKLIQLESNEGFAGGYNTGLSQIEADYFALLNQDVEVPKNWIKPVIDAMEMDESIAIAQPKILAQKNKTIFEYAGAAGGFIDALGYPFCRGRIFDAIENDNEQYNNLIECFWASGAAFFIRANIFKTIGGFDATFFAHFEEIDLCWRVKNAGYKVIAVSDAFVYHVGGSVIDYQSPRKTFLNFRNGLVVLHKNLPVSQLFWKMPIRFFLDVVAAYRALFSGDTKTYKAIAKAHFSYLFNLKKWQKSRGISQQQVNTNKIRQANLAGIYKRSIVWDFFIKKQKQFSKLQMF